MRNVTISLDEETATWARIEAAKRGTSIPLLLGGILKDHMKRVATCEQARRSYSNRPPTVLKTREDSYPPRNEIHGRTGADIHIAGGILSEIPS